LKCFVGAASPNIFKMVEIFKNEESSADKAFRKAVPQDIFQLNLYGLNLDKTCPG
jgi:hypothetical protein